MVWIGHIIVVALLGYFAFGYVRLTNFPIGDDPAVHITTIKNVSYLELARANYPLPLMIFKAAYQVSHVEAPQLFVWTISSFLFFSSLALFFFVYKTTGSWPLAAATAILFVTSRWVNDGLRMGVLGETFSWGVLFLTLTALARQKLIPTLVMTAVLVVSHPFAVLLYGIIAICYLIVSLLGPAGKEQKFARNLLLAYVGLALVGWLARPDLVTKFLNFASTDPAGWGDRPLLDILGGDDIQRLLLPLLGIIGLFVGARFWSKTPIKIWFFLLVIGIFMSLNYVLGFNFIPFRFYVYLEMGVAFFGALGLVSLIEGMKLPAIASATLAVLLSLTFAMPNMKVNDTIGTWQATNPDAHAVMTPADQVAIKWIKENIPVGIPIMAQRQQGLWLIALGEQTNVIYTTVPYEPESLKNLFDAGGRLSGDYLYYSVGQQAPEIIATQYQQIYDEGGVAIWERMKKP